MRENRFVRSLIIAFAIAIAFVLFPLPSSAQSARARILGHVVDPQGAAIAGASVVVTNIQTGVESKTTTDSTGNYQVLELPIGR